MFFLLRETLLGATPTWLTLDYISLGMAIFVLGDKTGGSVLIVSIRRLAILLGEMEHLYVAREEVC